MMILPMDLILASGCYSNVSTLKKELTLFREIFEKSIRYVVYPYFI